MLFYSQKMTKVTLWAQNADIIVICLPKNLSRTLNPKPQILWFIGHNVGGAESFLSHLNMQKKLTMQIIIQSRLQVFYIYTKNQEAHYCTIFYPKQIQQIITHLPIPSIRSWWSQCRVMAVVTAIHDEWDDQILCELTYIRWQPQSSMSCYFRFGQN